MRENTALFRFFGELTDFLSEGEGRVEVTYEFNGNPSVKDSIEAVGVPHTEVNLILVNGDSVGFGYQLGEGDKVSVYPVSEDVDVYPRVRLREKPPNRFILDVHLGKLARLLRMLGFDALYRNDYRDREIARVSAEENRVVLTRDRRLLQFRVITHGYWLRSTDPDEQLQEVIERYELSSEIEPFNRCMECNGKIQPVGKNVISHRLEPLTERYYDEFYRCVSCNKIYWKGSHYDQMRDYMEELGISNDE